MKKLQKQAFEMNNSDFLRAIEDRNFEEMADCYNEMMRYEDAGAPNDENKYAFAEISDGYVLQLPFMAKAKIKAIGKHFYYGLTEDYVCYVLNAFPEDDESLVYDIFKDDFLECEKVTLAESTITFTPRAIKHLALSVGDIMRICFENETIIIDKHKY